MKRAILLVTVMMAAVLVAFGGVAMAQQGRTTAAEDSPTFRGQDGERAAAGKLIVKIRDDATEEDLEALNRRNGASTDAQLAPNLVPTLYRLNLPAGLAVREAVGRYQGARDVVEYAEPDFTQFAAQTQTKPANDPYYTNGSLWGLNNTGSAPSNNDISAPEAWYTATGNSSKPLVAVIDEGIQYNHEDLNGNIWTNPDTSASDVHGWDFLNNDGSIYDGRADDHGTHVAGTIGAVGNNGKGVTGVNWQTSIIGCKFLGSSGGSTSNAIRCLDYVVGKGASVSNNSWGGGGYSQALLDAIKRARDKGHIFVAAAGNGGSDSVGDNNDTTPFYPARYKAADSSNDWDNVIAVAATGKNDVLRSWSNYGPTSVDLAAPGAGIYSTVPGRKNSSTYASYSGTSMATPHVTGTVALVLANNPSLSGRQVKDLILNSVDQKSSLTGKVATGGRLNAFRALGG